YQLLVNSHVSLKVYDVLGKEVATLVNEEKPAGYYNVEFPSVDTHRDASLPSGVYIYQLATGNYIKTKKMILIK
ncbi:MAG: T9SS type A sorting domain-containing protein, partial [Ignavibacteriaceae bacterium]|nr:T9SS type A sorting domain-containing protein [Ignavibacteriaceae bacterium]